MRKFIITLGLLLVITTYGTAQDWQSIHFPSKDNLTGIFFVHPDTGFVITNTGKFGYTTDKTTTWKIIDITGGTPLEDLYFINSKTGIVCGHDGAIYSTSDGGNSWKNLSLKNSVARFFDIEMFDDKNGLIIGLSNEPDNQWWGVEYKTNDGGKTWIKSNSQGMGYSEIYHEKNGPVYFLSYGKLHTSIDDGKKWSISVTHQGGPARTISFYKKFGILAGPGGIVYFTYDGGASWYPSQQEQSKIFVASQMVSESVAYIGGIQSPVMRSDDGGRTWIDEKMIKNFDVLDFYLIGNRLYACGAFGEMACKIVK